jgi:hypothetical protein
LECSLESTLFTYENSDNLTFQRFLKNIPANHSLKNGTDSSGLIQREVRVFLRSKEIDHIPSRELKRVGQELNKITTDLKTTTDGNYDQAPLPSDYISMVLYFSQDEGVHNP